MNLFNRLLQLISPDSEPIYEIVSSGSKAGKTKAYFSDFGTSDMSAVAKNYKKLISSSRQLGVHTPKIFVYTTANEKRVKKDLKSSEKKIRDELSFASKIARTMSDAEIEDSPDYTNWPEKELYLNNALYGLNLVKDAFYNGKFFFVKKEKS